MSLHDHRFRSDTTIDPQGDGASRSLRVLCLCAAWCGVCRDYRHAFDELGSRRANLSTYWIDIEDEEASLEDVEITTFPMVLILNQEGEICFSGPVVPHPDNLFRLCDAVATGSLVAARESTQCWKPLLRALRTAGRLS